MEAPRPVSHSRVARGVVISIGATIVVVSLVYLFTAFDFDFFSDSNGPLRGHRRYYQPSVSPSSTVTPSKSPTVSPTVSPSPSVSASAALTPSPPEITLFRDPSAISYTNSTLVGWSQLESVSFWYDNVNRYLRMDSVGDAFGLTYNYSNIAALSDTAITINGLCRGYYDQGYFDIFSWVQLTQYKNTETIVQLSGRQVTCDWFSFTEEGLAYRICAVNTTLFRYEIVLPSSVSLWDFSSSFSTAPFNHDVFEIPSECFENITCPVGPVEAVELYNFHEPNDFVLNDTNVADLAGDVSFVCMVIGSQGFSYFKWISQWQIEVNTTWGEYAFCNFGSCLSGSVDLVGRSATNSLGYPLNGQCVDNGLIGTWYSLPSETWCRPNQNVGDDGCTWKVIERTKTINASCLIDNGIESVCNEEINQLPFLGAQKIFTAAFMSDDPAEGGCPPIDLSDLYSQREALPEFLETFEAIRERMAERRTRHLR